MKNEYMKREYMYLNTLDNIIRASTFICHTQEKTYIFVRFMIEEFLNKGKYLPLYKAKTWALWFIEDTERLNMTQEQERLYKMIINTIK